MTALFFLLVSWPTIRVLSFVVLPSRHGSHRPLFSSPSEEAERLRESASKLRQEADALREKLGPPLSAQRQQVAAPAPVVYTKLKDSSWELTYLFSKDPRNNDNGDESQQEPTINYSGKLTVTFKADGYTDLVSHVPSGKDRLDIHKVWGWDEEESQEEDHLRCVLFSVNGDSSRSYWQARIDTDNNGIITLSDGTVTVKRDAVPGLWGVFDASGILAQFQYVGNFRGKPVRVA
jgi:hypothetical protein